MSTHQVCQVTFGFLCSLLAKLSVTCIIFLSISFPEQIIRLHVEEIIMTDGRRIAPAKDIDAYLELLPERDRAALEDLRAVIRVAAPDAQEGISYRIPVFIWNGPLVFFAAFKSHLGFYVVSKQILEQFKTELEPYKTSGTTIHFSADNPLPASLVTRIIKARTAENERIRSEHGKK